MARESREGVIISRGVVVSMPTRVDTPGAREPWLDERALARHYGVSTRTVRRWRAGGMPSRLFGGVRRYRLSECERWHEARSRA